MDTHSGCLPVDVMECVLSFLPIPTICKMKVVCKEWNKLTNNVTFHALCAKNGKNEDYMFLWRKDHFLATSHKSISPKFGETFNFFDLNLERWYSIPTTQVKRTCVCGPHEEMAQWFINMDNSLICEAVSFYIRELRGRMLSVSILDPIVKTSMEIPSLIVPSPPPSHDDTTPSLLTVLDPVSHTFKVFFFNTLNDMPLAHVLESGTQTWRVVGGLPCPTADTIAFRNTVIASLTKDWFQLHLFRYEVEGDTFAKVWKMYFPRTVEYSKLVVRHNRLFVLVITRWCMSIRGGLMLLLVNSEAELEETTLFEMYEVLLEEGNAKRVVQFTEDTLRAVWGEDISTNFWFAFPCFDSNGEYSSVVLMQHHSGEMRRFHLATRAVDVLPACPLSTAIPDMENVTSSFDAKTMPLSLMDVLKHAPPTV